MRTSIVVPTLNPGSAWDSFTAALLLNLRRCQIHPNRVLVLDSASTDDTVGKAVSAGFRVMPIQRKEFDHGGTRQLAVHQENDADFLIFLTQDAILASEDAIANLLAAFHDPKVAAAYGRQLPRQGASSVEAHARMFNYPATSKVRCFQDRETMGFKSIFASNSFCGYRRAALLEVGGFPSPAICSEETIAIGRMHMAGWCSAYVADAQAYHSHALSILDESRRYFDLGVTHARNPFLLEVFGTTAGEGRRFVLSELRFLLRDSPLQVVEALLRTLTKLTSYHLGRRESLMNVNIRRSLSMNRAFWAAESQGGPLSESPMRSRELAGPLSAATAEKPVWPPREQQPESLHLSRVEAAPHMATNRQGA